MVALHYLNLAVHIAAGLAGIALGFLILARYKGDDLHRRTGRRFVVAALIVCSTALIGNVAFRFLPLFAVLTLLVTYLSVGGWRTAQTRDAGPSAFDLAWTIVGIAVALLLVPILARAPAVGNSQPAVVWPSLGALGFVLAYDLARWTFPRAWFKRLWLPEHIYKVLSALFGMVSAFVGNVVRWGQPWSQIAPSIIGMCIIIWFVVRAARDPGFPNRELASVATAA